MILSKLDGENYPKELEGSWMYFVFFNNHVKLDGICCVYFNNKFSSGTICVGDSILNDYPDIYATWNKPDANGVIVSDRMSVSLHLRKKGLGSASLQVGAKILKENFNKTLTHNHGSLAGNNLWKSAFGSSNTEDLSAENNLDLQDIYFDQPAHPHVFFGKRVVGNE